MSAHAYIETEDLGLKVLGTTQYSYTVDGVHRQDYDRAVFKATLCRCDALEAATRAYDACIRKRCDKIDELGEALASVAYALGQKNDDIGVDDAVLPVGTDAANILNNYGFAASAYMSYSQLLELQQNVQYAIDEEDNEMQQDSTQIQNFITKRDDAMKTVSDLLSKISNTRAQGVQYVGS